MKLMAAVHCAWVGPAAAGTQLDAGMKLPVGSVSELLTMRLRAGKPIGEIKIDEVEQLVLLQRAAQTGAGGVPPFGKIVSIGVTVRGFQSAVAEEPVAGAVGFVLAALGDGVDYAAHGAPKFGREAIRQYLEFLDSVLRESGADAGTAGVLVVETLRRVVAIGEEAVAHGDSAEADQTEFAIVGDGGGEQHEADGESIEGGK